jgi:BlaI family penicillinase repressor
LKDKKRLPDSELTIMLAIWKSGAEKIHTGEILELLRKSRCGSWKTQTVQNLLVRLTEKGFLSCEKLGRLNFYNPLVSMKDYKEMETNTLLTRFYEGSTKSLFAALAEKAELSKDDVEEIKRLLSGDEGK